MADVIVNHISRQSPQFLDFDARGDASPYAGMFLTYEHVFPDGARQSDLLAIHSIRPGLPFTQHHAVCGRSVLLWTTFTSEQIDIDVHHPEGRRYLDAVLARLHDAGIRAIRVDAAGHAVKKAGTSCFMIPETLEFLEAFAGRAHALGLDVLVEVHGHVRDQLQAARIVDRVYDFALPPLVLHTLFTRNPDALLRWTAMRPPNAVTVLDTHDGIGVLDAAADGLLEAQEVAAVVHQIHERSLGESRLATGSAASNLDVHQVNCTFYDAVGARDDEYLIARALQCFLPGIPQIYYVGLLAGRNDTALLRRTGVGRDINRHRYTIDEVRERLATPVVQKLLALLRFRNSHPAFAGRFDANASARSIVMQWAHGSAWAKLEVDLTTMTASITSRPEAPGEGIGTRWH
jgi:sucrose phosphorylase